MGVGAYSYGQVDLCVLRNLFFFFNDTATTEIYTLSLHDALPICTLLEILPSQGITVATGEGALLLRRVQSAGVAEEPADVWALRRGMRPGVRLTEGA